MRIVIVGNGKVGSTLTQQLSREGHDIILIDNNPKGLQETIQKYDVLGYQGNGASLTTLREAGVGNCDLLIAVTSEDEVNLLSCVLARRLGNVRTIARVRNPEYVNGQQLYLLREELEISMTVNPELAAAREIASMLRYPSFLKHDTFARSRAELVEIKIGSDSPLKGIPLAKLYQTIRARVLICAVERGEEVHIPNGQFILEEGDSIFVTAGTEEMDALIQSIGRPDRQIRNSIIVGGGRLAFYLAQILKRSGIKAKIIEKDHDRCEQLAQELPGTVIVEGDGTLQDLLIEEGLEYADSLVALTNIDEENIVMSLHAIKSGVFKAIPKINREEYASVCQTIGLDTSVSPKLLCANQIVRFVRAMNNSSGEAILSLHRIAHGKAEAIEVRVSGQTRHLGEKFSVIPFKEDILVACIQRNGQLIVPSGSDSFEEGDLCILVTTGDHILSEINDVFAD